MWFVTVGRSGAIEFSAGGKDNVASLAGVLSENKLLKRSRDESKFCT